MACSQQKGRVEPGGSRQTLRETAQGSRKKNGPLGIVAIEVLEYMVNLIDHKTGRLEPSIATLMQKLNRSRDAIWKALNALRQHGFIDWLRRYVPTNSEGSGPQVQQPPMPTGLCDRSRPNTLLMAHPAPSSDQEQAEQEKAIITRANMTFRK